jgi:heme exporter protein A
MTAATTTTPEVRAGAALTVRDLARKFGHVRALRGVSFSLDRGDVLVVFGPNGAGKSTLLRLLAGVLRPDRGEIHVQGRRLVSSDVSVRRRIGLISHASLLYDGLTAEENLEFYARLYDLNGPRQLAGLALERVGLADRAMSPAAEMSRGMLQRLAIARALLHDPDVVLLDEPFTGLDERAATALREQFARLRAERRVIVLVTHNIDEGLGLATHVAIQVAGRFVECGPRSSDAAGYRERYKKASGG